MFPPSEKFPADVVGEDHSVQDEEEISYSQVETGRGDAGGESEKSPPYMKSELYECHNAPRATAGGPEGWGRPVRDGETIFHDFVRSSDKRLLSVEIV